MSPFQLKHHPLQTQLDAQRRAEHQQAGSVRIIQAGAYQAAYQEWGSGIPVVMLHGFMASHTIWWDLMANMPPGIRSISLDLLGFGQSSHPPMTYDIAAEVRFVRDFTQALGLERFFLMGHSFGGWVAAAYALDYPDQLEGLLLLAPAGIRDDSFCGRYDALHPLLWPTPLVDWGLGLLHLLAQGVGRGYEILNLRWLRHTLQSQPVPRQFLLERLRPEDAIDTVEHKIHTLTLPTLVLAAAEDDTIPLWHCQTYAERIQGAQLQILPGVGHHLPLREWRTVLPFIENFLEAVNNHPVGGSPSIKETKTAPSK